MVGKIIELVLRERLLVIALSVALVIGGLYAFKYLDIEAYPDPSPPTIEVIAQNPGWSAEEMERQITVPIETQLNGMPGIGHIRSISLFGLSDVKCYFQYESDYNQVRQEVLNRLQAVTLPPGVAPKLSPWSALGEIYRYQLVGPGYSLIDLRVAEDWIVERQFKQVPGILDVGTFGGPTKEFHVDLDPNKLIAYGISVQEVMAAIGNSNSNVGASYLDIGEQSYNVRGIGLFKNAEEIANVAVAAKNGTPLYLKQLGEVSIGAKVPLGRVGKDEVSDVIEGIVRMRPGEKSLPTLDLVREKVEQLNNVILPKGMKIVPYYDRTDLINLTTRTVTHTLIAGMVLVALIVIAFLGDLRASLVVALSVPLALLFTFVLMVIRGDSANLISMGAIDFGIIVDASVIMVENIYRHISDPRLYRLSVRQTTVQAAREVGAPIFFASAIIVAAFLPLFTMKGVEGKIFGPMALTYGLALTGALLLALTFSPALASLLIKPRSETRETFVVRWLNRAYPPLLQTALGRPILTIALALLAFVGTLAALPFLGAEFMPKLEEGNLWARGAMPNTISFAYSNQLADQMRNIMKRYPEVTTVVSQLGRPDDGTDPVSYFNCDFFISLKPREEWPPGVDKDELVRQMDADLRRIPGVDYNFSQNIEDNVEEAMSGVKGENSIKLFGDDLEKLEAKANEIEQVMKTVTGVADLGIFSELGQPNLLIQIDRKRAARYGVLPGDVNGVVQATIGGQAVTQVLDGERRFDIVVRFFPQYRGTVDAISSIPVNTPSGAPVPLRDVANITKQTGASYIYREDNGRYIPIKFSVRGRDLQSTIAEAEAKIKNVVKLPAGYHFEWAGQFQELQEAVKRLEIVVPISILLIFALLYGNFRDLRDSLLVLCAAPPALVGGILALLITHTTFSISAAVGFISLFGVSMLNGVVLISYIKELREKGVSLNEAVYRGSVLRLRPVLMASLAAAIGLLPASIATGIGSETQKPLARVVVGGMITSPILLLLVLPALYLLVHRAESVPICRAVIAEEGSSVPAG